MRNMILESRRWRGWLALLLSMLTFVGCEDDGFGGGTVGEEGRVEFSFQRSCFFGCPLEQPLLVGARERIALSDEGDLQGLTARASDPAVLELALERVCFCERSDGRPGRLEIAKDASCEGIWRKHCDNQIEVEAKRAGDSEVILEGRGGERIDRALVSVREADSALFHAVFPDQLGTREIGALELPADGTVELEVTLFDDSGLKLLAPEGVNWKMADPEVAIVSAWLIGRGEELSAGLGVSIEAIGEGETGLTVDVPGLSSSLRVTVSAP